MPASESMPSCSGEIRISTVRCLPSVRSPRLFGRETMSSRTAVRVVATAAAIVALYGCGGGVFRNPLAGESGHPPPRLSGSWAPCGTMGTGGPGQIALSADGSVVAVLFLQGQLAVHRVA